MEAIMSDTPTVEEVIERLRPLARPNALEGMARFGIATESALGVSMPDLRAMGKSLGRNHELTLDLWRTPLRETRILASLIADPQRMSGGRGRPNGLHQGLRPLTRFVVRRWYG
jgi:3-methyladenine DNA glycosylase AlkD